MASIVATNNGATITISTTDFKEIGTISETGGTLTWSGVSSNPETSQVTQNPGATSYTITYNANGGTGTMAATTAVVANTFTKEGYTFIRWNTASNGLGTDYAIGATPTSDITLYAIWGQNKAIGDSVSYSTTITVGENNSVTLDNWKVFYVDGDYTYIILDGYLPNNVINFENNEKNGNYSIWGYDPEAFLNEMLTSSNWNSLLIENKNDGTTINHINSLDSNIKALGSPTLELWVNSWNSSYPENTIYTEETTSAISDSIKGYILGLSKYKDQDPDDPSEPYRDHVYGWYIQLSNSEKDNKLYFPYTTAIDKYVEEEYEEYRCDGYWLASVTAYDGCYIFSVDYRGWIGDSGCRLGIL